MSNMIGYCANCNGMWLSNEQNDAEHLSDTDHGTRRACTEDTVGRTTLGVPIAVRFNVYLLGETYGGPEEGGWNKTTYEPVASLEVKARVAERWEDVGDAESGPRVVMQGYELILREGHDAKQKIEDYYSEKMFFDKRLRYDFVLEFGWPRYSEHPPYYC